MAADRLAEYRRMRDLTITPEPSGDAAEPHDRPIFVIQEHASSSHHFDVRLEVGDALASWAVPKGPSTDPAEKRLAIRVEDHPLDYADFEGSIPAAEYGGGSVIVWDIGPMRNLTDDGNGVILPLDEALASGHVTVWFEGEKLRGAWVFEHARVGGQDEHWLLIKADDDGADARRNPTSTEPRSVLSGRTVAAVVDEPPDEADDG